MSLPDVLEMETSTQTINYRKSRLTAWQKIQANHADYVASALKYGASQPQAKAAADQDARPAIRWLVGELLTHVPGAFAADFVTNAPREWGVRAEILLSADPAVPSLIARAYPVTSWAAHIDALSQQVAADDASWREWMDRVLTSLSPFGVSNQAMQTAFGLVDNVGKGLGGLGEGLGHAAGGLGAALAYVPLALGALGLGATILGVAYLVRTRPNT